MDAGQQPPSPGPDRAALLAVLVAWLASRCRRCTPLLDAEISVGPDGSAGLFATAALPSGSRPVHVPLACVLHASDPVPGAAVTAAIARLQAAARGCPPSLPAILVIRLAYERSLGAESAYAPYVTSLPPAPASLLHCSEDAATAAAAAWPAFGGSAAPWLARRASLRAALSRISAIVGDAWCTPAALLWAHAMVVSRAMLLPAQQQLLRGAAFGHHSGGGEPALVPLADVANHRPGALAHFVLTACCADGGMRSGSAAAAPAAPCAGGGGVDHAHMFDFLRGADAPAPPSPVALVAPPASSLLVPVLAGSKRPASAALVDGLGDATVAPAHACHGCVALQLGSPVRRGAEVCINYGVLDNAALLEWYGCALRANAADTVRPSLLQLLPQVPPALPAAADAQAAAFDGTVITAPAPFAGALCFSGFSAAATAASDCRAELAVVDLVAGLPTLDGLQLGLAHFADLLRAQPLLPSTAEGPEGALEGPPDGEVEAWADACADGVGRAAVRWFRGLLLELRGQLVHEEEKCRAVGEARAPSAPVGGHDCRRGEIPPVSQDAADAAIDARSRGDVEALLLGLAAWRESVRVRLDEHARLLSGL